MWIVIPCKITHNLFNWSKNNWCRSLASLFDFCPWGWQLVACWRMWWYKYWFAILIPETLSRVVHTAVPEVGLPITISQCLTGNTRGGVGSLQPFIRRAQRPLLFTSFQEFQDGLKESKFDSWSLLTCPKSLFPTLSSLFVTTLRTLPLSPS